MNSTFIERAREQLFSSFDRQFIIYSQPMAKLIDLTDKTFGRLVVLWRVKNHGKNTAWKCACVCQKTVVVLGLNLRAGRTRSCGCYRKELAKP